MESTIQPTTDIDLTLLPLDQLDKLKFQVKAELEPSIRLELKKQNEVDIALYKDEIRKQNDIDFRKFCEKFEEEERKRRTPLTPEELQKLLNKTYVTFSIELYNEDQKHIIVLKELPQSIEKELYRIVKDSLTTLAQETGGISIKDMEGDVLTNISGLMDLFIPMQEILVKCCTLCLNPPKGKERIPAISWLTEDWIKDNLSNYRIVTIILAQVEVNKMRDFFSILFQGFQSDVTKTLVGAQL
jgi:uncharacterized protein YeaO (DUF488 family)